MLIALLTDFGEEDWFVGTMKGVMMAMAPGASLVDVTHQVRPFDVRGGALALWSCFQYFPERTVFCCVVDPGVGTERSAIGATDGRHFFIAPDNGLLTLVARDAGADWRAYRATEPKFFLSKPSFTFQGRDVFAPLAARIASGLRLDAIGPALPDPVMLEIPVPVLDPGSVRGEVLHVDRFGNLITNIRRGHVAELGAGHIGESSADEGANWKLKIGEALILGLSKTFADRQKNELVFYWGSSDLLEAAVNQGNAAERLNASIGMEAVLIFP